MQEPLIFNFMRVEKKYLLTKEKYLALTDVLRERFLPDEHGKSTICNAYLDTPDFRLIRASIDAVCYKEKLRIRSYGTPSESDRVFFEIKKKYKGVVSKRRILMSEDEIEKYLSSRIMPQKSEVASEISYAMDFYGYPAPKMVLCYEREAYFAKEESDLRLTFDTRVRYRCSDLALSLGAHGKEILPEDRVLMEIKCGGGIPLWLCSLLSREEIYPTSFSKYGNAYLDVMKGRGETTAPSDRGTPAGNTVS